jgi:tetratricopeptide (TPR) repeat protein
VAYSSFDNVDSINHFIDSALYFANEAYLIAKKIDNLFLQASTLRGSSYAYQISGNYAKALEIELKALKLYEEINDSLGIAYTNDNIGAIYDDLDEIQLSIDYQKKAYFLYKKLNYTSSKLETANHIGYGYTLLNMPDSALPYFQEAYTIVTKGNQFDISITLPFALFGLGKVNYQYGNYSIALPYYKKALELSKNAQFYVGEWYTFIIYTGMAEVFAKQGLTNEAITYYKKAIGISGKDKLTPGVYIALSNLYKNTDPAVAYKYLSTGMNLRDSLFTAKNKIIIQNITNGEKERQRILQEQIKIEQEERERNIQFMAIGICIISFIIIYLLISRTILVKPRVIRLLGVIGLLITFEFINLLLHPFLERITHHSPFLMLICLATLASLIVPIHHWLEKWVTTKVVQKNETFRINVAKRILDESNQKKN